MAETTKTVAPEGGAPVPVDAGPVAPSQQSPKPTPGSQAAPTEIMVPPEKPQHQDYVPQGDSEQFLLGPTSKPQEPVTAGISPRGTLHPPKGFDTWFPVLDKAAQDPGAPPQLKLLIQLLLHHKDNA